MQALFLNTIVDSIHQQTKTFLNTIDPSEQYTKPIRKIADANTEFAKTWVSATEKLTDAYTVETKFEGGK